MSTESINHVYEQATTVVYYVEKGIVGHKDQRHPSIVTKSSNGELISATWTNDGQLHNLSGPAVMLKKEELMMYLWYIEDVRTDAPSQLKMPDRNK